MDEHSNQDELDLVLLAQHDPQAFGTLYDRYVDRIYGFVLRRSSNAVVAADVTAQTFEQALRHIRRFRWRGVSFGAWLYRIARNELAQHERRERWLRPFRWDDDLARSDREIHQIEQHDEVAQVLQQLSRTDQDILTLRFWEDLSYAEISEILNCSVDNAYLRVHRALQRLRKRLVAQQAFGGFHEPEA